MTARDHDQELRTHLREWHGATRSEVERATTTAQLEQLHDDLGGCE